MTPSIRSLTSIDDSNFSPNSISNKNDHHGFFEQSPGYDKQKVLYSSIANQETFLTTSHQNLITRLRSTDKKLTSSQNKTLLLLREKKNILKEIFNLESKSFDNFNDLNMIDLLNSSEPLILHNFVESCQINNSILGCILENSFEFIKCLEIYTNKENSPILNRKNILEKLETAINEGTSLIHWLNRFLESIPNQLLPTNIVEYRLDRYRDDLDEARETNKMLKQTLYHQTKLISELNQEIYGLKQNLLPKDTKSTTSELSITKSISYGIEPLRRACSKYNEEFRRSIRELEKLLHSAKLVTMNSENENQSKIAIDEEVSSAVELCSSISLLLNSVKTSTLNESDSCKIHSCVTYIQHLKEKLKHVLAQLCCDESMV